MSTVIDIFQKRKTINRGIISIIDQGIVSSTNFLTGILIGRTCTKDEFGLYILGMTIVTFMIGFQSSLITSPYMIYVAKQDKNGKESFTGNTFIHQLVLSITTVIMLMSVWFFIRSAHAEFGKVISALAGAISFILIREYIRLVSLSRLHAYSVLLLDILVSCIQIIGILLLAHYGILSASRIFWVVGFSCGISGICLIIWRHEWFILKLQEVVKQFVRNLGVGRWFLASLLVNTLSKELYAWMLTFFQNTATTGTFGASTGIVNISHPLVIGITNFLGPLFAHAYANNGWNKLSKLIRKSTLLVLLVMGIFCGALFLCGEELVVFVYGTKYSGNGLLVSTLALATLTSVLTTPIGIGLWTIERPDINFKACLGSLAVTMILGVLLVKYLGLIGVGLSLLIGNICESLIKYYSFRKIGELHTVDAGI